ncbi:MAG TPA: altronate oxidoreductase [bacterium]
MNFPATVLQFGGGHFNRGFFNWMLHRMNEKTGTHHGVFLVEPTHFQNRGKATDLNPYYLWLRGVEEGQCRETVEEIKVLVDGANPFKDFDRILSAALSPDLRLVTSNTTEAGLRYGRQPETNPETFPAFLARLLKVRSEKGLPPLYLLPLELLENNGRLLKEAVAQHGQDWGYPNSFFDYLDRCPAYNTLVDRIVPGAPPTEEAKAFFEKNSLKPARLITGELFHLLAIEGQDASLMDVFPFQKSGLNVVFTQDLAFYRDRKVGLLNGAHTAMVGTALLNGIATVREIMEHPAFGPAAVRLMEEIVDSFRDPEAVRDYSRQVLERFRDPALHHRFRSIALNSISKVNTRLGPALERSWEKHSRLPNRLAMGIADLVELYRRGPIPTVPGEPLELSDWRQLEGNKPTDILKSFFPGIKEKKILAALEDAVNKIYPTPSYD